MSEHQYKFGVNMHCGGCSGAVERVLKKLDGVKSYEVSLETQTATVTAEESLDYDTVLKTIKKTGKQVKSGEADGKEMYITEPEVKDEKHETEVKAPETKVEAPEVTA